MDAQTRAIFLRYFSTDMVNPETVNVDTLLDVLQDLLLETPTPTKLTISL